MEFYLWSENRVFCICSRTIFPPCELGHVEIFMRDTRFRIGCVSGHLKRMLYSPCFLLCPSRVLQLQVCVLMKYEAWVLFFLSRTSRKTFVFLGLSIPNNCIKHMACSSLSKFCFSVLAIIFQTKDTGHNEDHEKKGGWGESMYI